MSGESGFNSDEMVRKVLFGADIPTLEGIGDTEVRFRLVVNNTSDSFIENITYSCSHGVVNNTLVTISALSKHNYTVVYDYNESGEKTFVCNVSNDSINLSFTVPGLVIEDYSRLVNVGEVNVSFVAKNYYDSSGLY